ncbi:GNAT family N-acetyltransferase [Solimicrobium silvestre]|uniref:Acetyltransferase (GNAT) family n=1 Tax=Solimicrobium silvestre TaxID=2099400 RepID=A0A2S9H2K6_9BURK|nr:GNAT family N-acetyltransferase [Solimicrobium silvestre]PRC94198.1 Acetyltransferase (GNAT) family [Solimicrobium silvestre]
MNNPPSNHRTVLVKELSARHRSRVSHHFSSLDQHDRILRFGTHLSNESISNYVKGINFELDKVFGVFSYSFRLVGVGHLAFVPRADRPLVDGVIQKVAEFGVSVSSNARGLGIGSKLFERAAIHCRNANVTTLYMHCLSSNQTMMHIAKKAGMEIHRDYGEADAYLTVLPADPGSVIQEAMQEQVASLDYSLKANTSSVLNFLGFGKKKK